MRVLKPRLHESQEAGSSLKFALYKAAHRELERTGHPNAWKGGWNLLRGLGKKYLHDDNATDADCAVAVIEHCEKKSPIS